MVKKIALLGSTGSIGTNTLDIVARHPDYFQIVSLAAGKNIDVVTEQIRQFNPKLVSVCDEADAQTLQRQFSNQKVEIVFGNEGAKAVACHESADLVISAIVGAAGLEPTLTALQAGKAVALANKESLIIAGKIMTQEAKRQGTTLFPIDSEHSAIFQALEGNDAKSLKRILLTASGGPFFNKPLEEFQNITVEQALKHPNWDMGAKITIDSATMMNKGLEVIEATWLFDVGVDVIDVHIHPQSIIHSMVEYIDGSVMAQLGVPDMRCAISYAMAYPERIESGVESLNLFDIQSLTFYQPDLEKFRCLQLACEAVRAGESCPAVLNAANEVAVEAFLKKKIAFLDIPAIVEAALQDHDKQMIGSLEDVLAADHWARDFAQNLVEKRGV
jgi:1-deoxy-D-xylulose-5-phosphate reductoisomerase